MRHLTLEALARLVDEAPGAREKEHLEECGECRRELEALRVQTEALATLPKLVPAPDRWAELQGRLRAEGLLQGTSRPWLKPSLIRIAAGLALFIAGGAAGYAARGPAATPEPVRTADAAPAPAAEPDAIPVAGEPALDPTVGPAGITEEVARTEQMFAAALDRYMRANATEAPDPAARLAALDNIVLTTAEALNESPADPVINGYHLTAVAQRNELLRQLAASSDEPVF
jgi:hypothetical protein